MAASKRLDLQHSAARTSAALVGSIPVALALGSLLACALPLSIDKRMTLGAYAVVPIWTLLACLVFLAPSGKQAWQRLGLIFTLALASLYAAHAARDLAAHSESR